MSTKRGAYMYIKRNIDKLNISIHIGIINMQTNKQKNNKHILHIILPGLKCKHKYIFIHVWTSA